MRKLGARLPSFTAAESAKLKGSADFFGLNHYGSQFARDSPSPADYGMPNGTEPMCATEPRPRARRTPGAPLTPHRSRRTAPAAPLPPRALRSQVLERL